MYIVHKLFAVLAVTGAVFSTGAHAQGVIRHKIPGSDFPISLAIEVPPGLTLVNLSGAVPDVVDAKADANSVAAFGDTQAQAISVLKKIEGTLKSLNLGMSDVIKMQVFLVKDPALGKVDLAGFMKGYKQYFGTAQQPNLPTRSAFEIAGLANPGWLLEIEVSAVRPPK
ncbi:hypothetical protein D5041_02755 [Verminephrobacter aporrectodeae subsp. tuberculatae]|uniref:RidA family protein n=1 Tax=Verminephrobacter aporrectodeae TaxID=1110389 RepID=UPI00389B12B2|nr:hypothetical protein [Verminephrobacter aporrectodeae subsp. tuberculatae]MCW5288021.1 hypothetical protein [Verminephrobacter aporrectodeae subsp. tuberculatae]